MPKLLDQVSEVIRMKHYSVRTEQAYINWIKRYIFFHNKRHPAEMGEDEIRAFISEPARKVRLRVYPNRSPQRVAVPLSCTVRRTGSKVLGTED